MGKTEMISSKVRNKTRVYTPSTLVQFEILARALREEKGIKMAINRKEKIKLFIICK
jgi:hypothetical protein